MRRYLRDIAEIGAGQGAPQGDHNYCDDGLPFVKAGNLQELTSGGSINDIQKVSDEVAKAHKLKLYPKGTVLFAKSGMSCLKGYVYVLPVNAYVVSHLACITPKEKISEYLRLYFTFHKPNQLVKDAAYPSISLTDIGNLEVDTKDEQTRGHIITVLKSVEEIIELRTQELQRLDDLIKARFVEMFGDPMTNPKGFPIKTIDEVSVLNKGITYAPEDVSEEGIIVLRSSNIKGSEFDLGDLVKIKKNVSPDKYVKENDILMCNRNGSARLVGKVALIPMLTENMTFGTFMTIVRSDIYDYLFAFFQMDAFREQIKFQTAVAINQISLPLLASVKLPIPPKEQIEEFSKFKKQIDKSKVVVQKALDQAQVLFDSLMQQYFGMRI